MSNIDQNTDPNLRMVNGPVNVLRLEGELNGIPKVIYLFMDFHEPIESQTQCANVFSKDVQQYFVDSFYNLSQKSDKFYDFFLEVYPSELAPMKIKSEIEPKKIYIEEVVKMFIKIFQFDPKKNRVQTNDVFNQIRLHYLDVRDYYKFQYNKDYDSLRNVLDSIRDNITVKKINFIIEHMESLQKGFHYMIKLLSNNESKVSNNLFKNTKIIKSVEHPDTDSIEYLANKIKNSYNHLQVKNAMRELINITINNFKKASKFVDSAIDRFQTHIKKLSNRTLTRDDNSNSIYNYGPSSQTVNLITTDVVNTIEILINEMYVEYFARFTDIYFLRRFLDKDYITNAVVYSGAKHSNTYVYTLVKYFDFKVTHASYSKIKNLNQLNDEIKKRSLETTQELIYPIIFGQCSNLTNFPLDFK